MSLELDHGDTGEALLTSKAGPDSPVPVSAQAERLRQSIQRLEKVKDQGAQALYDTATESECRYALAWLSGYAPELYERAMRRARGDFS